jgi:hypothetical protein
LGALIKPTSYFAALTAEPKAIRIDLHNYRGVNNLAVLPAPAHCIRNVNTMCWFFKLLVLYSGH